MKHRLLVLHPEVYQDPSVSTHTHTSQCLFASYNLSTALRLLPETIDVDGMSLSRVATLPKQKE